MSLQQLQRDIQCIKVDYPNIQLLTSGVRSMEDQMYYVVNRWDGYPTTKKEFKAKFSLTDTQLPRSVSALTSEQDTYLRSRIQYHSDQGHGFRHLSGNAVDVSVASIDDWRIKELIRQRILALGYNIILERPPRYYVSIQEATTLHVELK